MLWLSPSVPWVSPSNLAATEPQVPWCCRRCDPCEHRRRRPGQFVGENWEKAHWYDINMDINWIDYEWLWMIMIDLDHWSLVLLRNCESLSHQSLNHMHWHATNQSTDSVSIPRSISFLPLSSKPLWIVPSFSFNTTWHFLALQIDSQLQGQAPQGPDPPKDTFCSSVRSSRFGFFFLLLFLAQRACRGASAQCQNMLSVGELVVRSGKPWDQYGSMARAEVGKSFNDPEAANCQAQHLTSFRRDATGIGLGLRPTGIIYSTFLNVLKLTGA